MNKASAAPGAERAAPGAGRITPPTPFSQLSSLLLPTFKRHRWRLAAGFAALLFVDFLQLLVPRILKHGVDGLEARSLGSSDLALLAALIVAIAALVVALRFAWRTLIIGFSRLLEQSIRNRIFYHLVGMDPPFYERHSTGDLMAHSSNDLGAVQMACGMGLVAAVDALILSLAAVAFMVAIHPLLTFFALLPMPFLALATRYLSGRLHRRFTTVQEQFSALTEFSRSTLLSVGLIKAYTMEDFQTGRFEKIGRQYLQSNLRVARIQGLITPLAGLVGSFGMLMVLYFGGRLVIEEQISLGDFVAFITYLYMLIWPMMAIGWVANLVQRGITSLGRIHTLVTAAAVLPDPPAPAKPPTLSTAPTIVVQGLTFHYQSSPRPILTGLDLELGPGIHGLTGRTGSGKSTLCKLLARLYPVADGSLFFTGHDANTLPLDLVRDQIAYVSQEPILFSDTIAANILLGNPEAGEAAMLHAARQAAIHDDILSLPGGYQTLIGERGVKLSGGQRQRLALARALLCDRPILIIDDGLSAVDVATEHAVFADLRRHFTGKTVLVVSNRIKLLSMTDRTIVLADGRVADIGRHEELLERNSLYRQMFAKQMAGNGISPPQPGENEGERPSEREQLAGDEPSSRQPLAGRGEALER